MCSPRRIVLASWILLASPVLAAGPPEPSATLEIQPAVVSIDGAAPGSTWVLLGEGIVLFHPTSTRRVLDSVVLVDEDRDGRLDHRPVSGSVPPLSTWVAFEPVSGLLLRAATKETPLPEELAASSFALVDDEQLELAGSHQTLALLRGSNAPWFWNGTTLGAVRAPDGESLNWRVGISSFEPRSGGEQSPTDLRRGDVLVAIDQRNLATTILKID